jgi:hypothetical protein
VRLSRKFCWEVPLEDFTFELSLELVQYCQNSNIFQQRKGWDIRDGIKGLKGSH